MDNKECIITVELGTNGVRVMAFNLRGESIGSMKGSYPTFHTQPDYSEQDPEQIFITMLYVLKNLLTEVIHPKHYNIVSICFSASMHSVLPIDQNGEPLGNAITWADNRGKREAIELNSSSLGKRIYNATGTPIHPMSPLIKIAWLSRNDRGRFVNTYKFLSIKSYIIQQLTGEYVLDYSLASATGLLNIHKASWEHDALAYAGIKADLLPELISVFASPGKLRKEYQKSLGLHESVKILIGSSDGCLATLGGGVWEEGKATITIEDSGAVRTVGKQVIQDEKQRFFNYLLWENYYVSGGPTNNGGIVFEWFTKQFGDFKGPFDIDHAMENLMREAATVSAGSEGLLFLPYLLGERAPIWNANARGNYFGINIKHEKQHFVRATIEGILYEVYSIGRMLQEHRRIDTLTVNGSFASIPLIAQMLADIFNKPVYTGSNPDSIARGAYLLSAIDLGIYKSLDEAARSIHLPITVKPQSSNHNVYQKYFPIFERLSTKLNEEFEAIANVQQEEYIKH
ncbi:gluconokinase [Chryseosolibacter indicus]|uniref:Gluconokinase n=1 Tax=Chryseosolibacter indicus TaxID=2782351 RepID=A0ABS5VKI7_9BACT|nr:gluconokinase [Chryseosolibacter indicus]MBT1701957.1 gluconokinase [Chryseosolibacter indicus]